MARCAATTVPIACAATAGESEGGEGRGSDCSACASAAGSSGATSIPVPVVTTSVKPPTVRGDDRTSERERLHGDEPETLAAAGNHDCVCSGHPLVERGPRQRAEEAHRAAQAEPSAPGFERSPVGTVADDVERDVGAAAAGKVHRVEQHVEALLGRRAAHRDEAPGRAVSRRLGRVR